MRKSRETQCALDAFKKSKMPPIAPFFFQLVPLNHTHKEGMRGVSPPKAKANAIDRTF